MSRNRLDRLELCGRRGIMLAATLVIVVLLTMLGLSFGFAMRANVASIAASGDEFQARLAAEAGIQRVISILRSQRDYANVWTDNPEAFADVLVWSAQQEAAPSGFARSDRQPKQGPAWRFSIVADDPSDDEKRVRFGIVPESGKLNINVATAEQLTALFEQVLDPTEVVIAELVDALLDWRDRDDETRLNGAESDYYSQLEPTPYRAKNRPFETVEELLLVRGFSTAVLFGEDYNRNGLLDSNEDDGDDSFPPDNADGQLDRGLLPFITVWSRELNTAADNRPRINLNARNVEQLAEQLTEFFEPAVVEFIVAARKAGKTFASPADLLEMDGSPVGLEDMPTVMDRLTTRPLPGFVGLVNVNAAPAEVLRSLGVLSEEEVAAIIQARDRLSDEDKLTTAWLLTEGVLSLERFKQAEPLLTTKAMQFSVESLGYADHVGLVKRISVVLEMRGPRGQILYCRDLTPLGLAYHVRELGDEVFGTSSG